VSEEVEVLETQVNPENNQIRYALPAPLLASRLQRPEGEAEGRGGTRRRVARSTRMPRLRVHARAPTHASAMGISIGGRVSRPILLRSARSDSRSHAASNRRVRVADGWVSLTDTFGEPLLEPC
jgi:hypothetical protein